jgi:hypothetical protein
VTDPDVIAGKLVDLVRGRLSPDRAATTRDKISARIDQLEIMSFHASSAGITLSNTETSLIDSITHRLYRERARDVVDSLAIRAADNLVTSLLDRMQQSTTRNKPR